MHDSHKQGEIVVDCLGHAAQDGDIGLKHQRAEMVSPARLVKPRLGGSSSIQVSPNLVDAALSVVRSHKGTGNRKRRAAEMARGDNARSRRVRRREEQCADDSAIDPSAAVEFGRSSSLEQFEAPALGLAVREAGSAPGRAAEVTSFATLLERVRAKERAAAVASEADT
jgi:hypothetical protein